MDFEFTDDQLELRDAARSVLTSACPASLVRAVYEDKHAEDAATAGPARLWATLVGLDWPALGVAEEDGGLGLGFLEVGILVEEMGRLVAPSPFVATVTQLAPMLRESGASRFLREVAAGKVTGTVALAEDGRWSTDAVACTASRLADGDGWRLDGCKSHVLDGATADELAVVAVADDGLGVFLVPGTRVTALPLGVIDPTTPLATVTLDGVAVEPERVLVEPGDPRAETVIGRVLEEATTALALSTVATCRTIFETTLQYAKDRHQFGVPIGSFQAIKHRLADCYLAVERAASLAWFAALTIAEDDDRRTVATSMAKSAAGDCQELLTNDGLQLHGGVGFTWEHDLHFALKRAASGELLFGTSLFHRARLARLLGLEVAA